MSKSDNIPTRQEVEQIVNDERVPWDTRRALAMTYIDYVEDEDPGQYGFRDETDRNGFRDAIKDKMKISEWDLANVAGTEAVLANSYSDAKGAYDEIVQRDRQSEQNAVNGAKSTLAAAGSRASETEPGAGNSNEILDTGVPGLKSFDLFVPLYNRAAAAVGGFQQGDLNEIHLRYDEQRDIPFVKFTAGGDEFTALANAVTHSADEVSGTLRGSLSSWDGGAAEQARAYQQEYEKQTRVVAGAATHAATGVRAAAASVAKFCRDKAKWVLDYYLPSFGEVTPGDLDRIIRLVELGRNASQDDFKHCGKFLPAESQSRLDDDSCDLDDETMDYIVEQARAWLSGTFCPWFRGHLDNYRSMCDNTRTAVDGAWKALADFFAKLPENPFAALPAGQWANAATQPQQAPVPQAGSAPPAPAAAPSMPAPAMPAAAPSTPATQPAPAVPAATTPAASTRPEDPASTVDSPRGGTPGHRAEPGPEEPEKLTVRRGEHELSLTEPDEHGAMDISVDQGPGAARDYHLDFGSDPDNSGDPSDSSNPSDPAADSGNSHHRAEPSTGPAADRVYRPGEDGRIRIEDDGLSITAERPDGPDGPTVVTVDDGTGEPTSYTMDDDGKSTVDDPPDEPASHAAEPEHRSDSGYLSEPDLSEPRAMRGDLGDLSELGQDQQADPGTDAEGATSPQAVGLEGLFSGGDSSQPLAAAPDGAGVATAPDGADQDGGSAQDGVGAGMLGGMGMLGGAGGGAGDGADQERAGGVFRMNGDIFDIGPNAGRISGSLDDEADRVPGGRPPAG